MVSLWSCGVPPLSGLLSRLLGAPCPCSIFPGRHVNRLRRDCDGITDCNGIVRSVMLCLCVCVELARISTDIRLGLGLELAPGWPVRGVGLWIEWSAAVEWCVI